ncbi:MAG: hypothetical protein VW942_06085, partial [Aquiluna sp.]
LVRLGSEQDDFSWEEAEAIANAESRLLTLRQANPTQLSEIGRAEAERLCVLIDQRNNKSARGKGIEQNNLQRSTDAKEKKRICRKFFLGYCKSQKARKSPSRQEAFKKLKREWRDLSKEQPELKSPCFSSFKDYCKGL